MYLYIGCTTLAWRGSKSDSRIVVFGLRCNEAWGPMKGAVSYERYMIHTRRHQRNQKMQNSCVVVKREIENEKKDFMVY